MKSLIKFCMVGASNTLISLAIYYGLLSLGIHYAVAITAGYIISSISGFFLSKTWVFKKNTETTQKSIVKYYILYASALLLNVICMSVFIKGLRINEKIAPILTVVITTIYNFILSRNWVFKKGQEVISLKRIAKDKSFIIISLIFAVFVGALFANNIFNHPVADDYSNYNKIMSEMNNDPNYKTGDLISAIFNLSISTYQTWQGTYFANILFYINPLLISLDAYKITMLLIQLFWILSALYFFLSFEASTDRALIRNLKLFMVFIISSILFSYSLGEGFYWFTGSILYIIPFSISMLLFGTLIRFMRQPSKIHYPLLILLSIILGGTSYVTGLVVGFILLLTTIYAFMTKHSQRFFLLSTLLIFCVGFALNVLCPGNFKRTSSYEKISVAKALIYSAINSIAMLSRLLFKTAIIPIFITISPLLAAISKRIRITAKRPLLISVLFLACFVCTFAPMAYAYGSTYQETRVLNTQFLYLILFIAFCFTLYLSSNQETAKAIIKNKKQITLTGILAVFLMTSSIGINNISGLNLIQDFTSRSNVRYDACMDSTTKTLQESTEHTVLINNCDVYPTSLHYYIITNDGWQTDALETYFKKDIIIEENK